MGNFEHDDQAMMTGLLVGLLMKHGIDVRPEVDPEGNYTPVLFVKIDMGENLGKPMWVDVAVAVLP